MITAIATEPLPVEITNHADLWAQWLPLIVALIALGGVVWANVSSDKRARQREFIAWQRDKILELGTQAISDSLIVQQTYNRNSISDAPLTPADFQESRQATQQIHTVSVSLGLLGADDAAERCAELRDATAGEDMAPATFALNAVWRDTSEDIAKVAATQSRLVEAMKPLTAAQAALTTALRHELRRLMPAKSRDTQ
jgi:hypothetical protein